MLIKGNTEAYQKFNSTTFISKTHRNSEKLQNKCFINFKAIYSGWEIIGGIRQIGLWAAGLNAQGPEIRGLHGRRSGNFLLFFFL